MRVRSKDEDSVMDLLKACARKKDLLSGIKIHEDVLKRGLLGKKHSVASSLISMYAKCGDLAKAWELHEELHVRGVVSWSILIAGYAQLGRGHEAINCFEQMQNEGLSPDAITFTCILKACSITRSIEKGEEIHDMIVDRGFVDKDIVLSNALIDMYAKCGVFGKAKQVLEGLRIRKVVSWNALISGYASHKQGHEALDCLERMQNEGVFPDAITFSCILKACGSMKEIEKGKHVHEKIVSLGLLDGNVVLGNALIDMYVKCGVLEKAHQVLEVIPLRDVVSWSILMAGYVEQGKVHETLECFDLMRNEGIVADVVIFACILKACGSLGDLSKGTQLHDEIVRRGFVKKNVMLGNALVDMYVNCGMLEKAQKVHDELLVRNVYSWNSLIAGYAQHSNGHEAMNCFQKMQSEGLSPDRITYICILKACGKTGSIEKGEKIHDEIINKGLFMEKDIVLNNALVDMYAKCGVLPKAQQLVDEHPHRNVISWNSLISGYVQEEQYDEALNCFDRMQSEGHVPDMVTFTCILNACGGKGAFEKGEQIHEEIVNSGWLDKNIVLGTALVDMYAKCGQFVRAHEVLDQLSVRDVVAWSVLIAGYTLHGQGRDAINSFDSMQIEGLSPDVVTLISVLKACGSIGLLDRGKQIHDDIVRRSLLDRHDVLANALVDMYGKCGALTKAQLVHDQLPVQNVSSWNALISGYVQHKQAHEALHCFEQMKTKGFSPDHITYLSALKACGVARAIDMGKNIHNEIIRQHILKENIELNSAVVDMYSKCGMIAKAHEVLDELPVRNIVSWNALITGYVQEGQGHKALNCYEQMESEGLSPDVVTFQCILKACGNAGILDKGKQIHDAIVNKSLLEKNPMLGNALVDMYAKCGELEKAERLHDVLPTQSISSWNALINGYVLHGQNHQAMTYFQEMQNKGLLPDAVTFNCILKTCGRLGALNKGKQIHDQIVSSCLLEENVMLGTAVVDMYAKCGLLAKARQVHDELRVRNIVSWNVLITGYTQEGQADNALKCLERIQNEGHSPDAITFTGILRACGSTGAIEKGEQIHEEIVSQGLLKGNIVLGTALVDMYAKCGMLTKAQKVLEELSVRDVVCWSALITGYAQQGQGYMALNCFDWMQREGLSPNEVTLSCFLKACGNMGAIEKGEEIHAEIANNGLLEKNIVLATALVDMYAKCGALSKARIVHNELPVRTVASWNALIAGYAQEGQNQEALKCLMQMQSEGIGPNEITFVCLLDACSHSGKPGEAKMYFGDMGPKYHIMPSFEHHTCMVVIFGSAGDFDMALSVIKTMPSSHYPSVWVALLSACRKWGNLELGRLAFDQVVQIDDNLAEAYVFMANIYVAAGMLDDAEKVEAMIRMKKMEM